MDDDDGDAEMATVPDLMNDGPGAAREAAQGDGIVADPGSPTMRMERAESSNGSESYGGNVHYQPAAAPAGAGPSGSANVSPHLAAVWAQAEAQLQARARNAPGAAQPPANQDEDAAVDLFGHDMQFNPDGTPVNPPYPGYNSAILNVQGDTQPILPSGTDLWVKMDNDLISQMKPARAIRVLVPASLFKRDASHFSQWGMPATEGSARAYATAALTSAVFAGTQMGIPCGAHAERRRQEMRAQAEQQNAQAGGGQGRKEKSALFDEAHRYVYIPGADTEDEWPMWQMGYEEILNEAETDVTFVGVWLWTYDPTHSTSYLLAQVMKQNQALARSQRAAAQAPDMRHKGHTAEMERRKKAGMSFKDLNTNFESTVGVQFNRITNMTQYNKLLKNHAGISVTNKVGKMFVQNFDRHMDCPAGRRVLSGDKEHGFGSFHPAAIEFACNAKRVEGLTFGATNLDGTPGDIHPKFLNPESYWNGDFFRLPEGTCDMWICGSVDCVSIFEMPLPRKLQNQVLPGDELMYLFLEREAQQAQQRAADAPAAEPTAADIAAAAVAEGGAPHADLAVAQAEYQAAQNGNGDEPFGEALAAAAEAPAAEDVRVADVEDAEPMEEERPRIKQDDYARFRSFITQTDETMKAADQEIRDMLRNFDSMDDAIASSISSSNTHFSVGSKDGSYKVQTVKMSDRVSAESTNAFDKIVNPWHEEQEREITRRRTELEIKGVSLDDPVWEEIEKDEIAIETRFAKCKDDLARYHLRCVLSCFHSEHDRHTLPDGFKAMVKSLEEHVKNNGNCASMAFRPNGKGMQITGSDRQVWHELQEWLGLIFSKDALIEGRDRFLMDELYLQSFEPYAGVTFVLILCSEPGKGKSVRAKRLMKLLPPGIATDKAASSARAGMNGTQRLPPSYAILHLPDALCSRSQATCSRRTAASSSTTR